MEFKNLNDEKEFEECEKLLEEVIENFPDVKKGDVKLGLDYSNEFICKLAGYDCYEVSYPYKHPESIKIKRGKIPTIYIEPCFFSLPKEEKQGILAHELGHHNDLKEKTDESLKIRHKLQKKLKKLESNEIKYLKKRKLFRLSDFLIQTERAANNYVAQTKYAPGLINFYSQNCNSFAIELLKHNLEQKIANTNIQK